MGLITAEELHCRLCAPAEALPWGVSTDLCQCRKNNHGGELHWRAEEGDEFLIPFCFPDTQVAFYKAM